MLSILKISITPPINFVVHSRDTIKQYNTILYYNTINKHTNMNINTSITSKIFEQAVDEVNGLVIRGFFYLRKENLGASERKYMVAFGGIHWKCEKSQEFEKFLSINFVIWQTEALKIYFPPDPGL